MLRILNENLIIFLFFPWEIWLQLDNKGDSYFKAQPINAFTGKTALSSPPTPPLPPPPIKRLFCQEIHAFPLATVAIWDMDSSFPDCFSVLEAVEKKTGGYAPLSLRPCQVLYCICLQQKFVKFPLQLWRYRCVTEAWLPWAAAMWSSNVANDACSSFNFVSASVWDKQGWKEANKTIRLAWISTAWKGYVFHW